MGLMTSMYTGVSGLQGNQIALNVTSNNISNINTPGYVRQQVVFADTKYQTLSNAKITAWQVGHGTQVADTRHLRDLFLDKSYRQESGRENFYGAKYDTVLEIETIVGELEGVAFQESMEELWTSINEVAKTPSSTTARASLVLSAESFLNRANAVHDALKSYQKTLNTKVIETVDRINELGKQIYELNNQIARIEASKTEAANDLRDTRDVILDELGQLIKIDYEENSQGVVLVSVENVPFITEGTVFNMETAELNGNKSSTYLSPVWPHLQNQEVFKLGIEISTAKNNDIGMLKGYLQARGDYVASYTDIPNPPTKPLLADYTDVADFTADLDQYYLDYADYELEVDSYNKTLGYSTIMTTQALFDKLINGIVTSINDILAPNKEEELTTDLTLTDEFGNATTYPAGTKLIVLDQDKASKGSDADKTIGTELFSRLDASRYTKMETAGGEIYYIYNENNEFGTESLYKLGNLSINNEVREDYGLLPFTNKEGEEDLKMGEELIKVWESAFTNLDPSDLTVKNFKEFYTGIINANANSGSLYRTIAESQNKVTSQLNDQRNSYMGVSSEEELSNMIRFQNAYNASSRYINVIDQMLQHIIEKL